MNTVKRMVRPDNGLTTGSITSFEPREYRSIADLTSMIGAILTYDVQGNGAHDPEPIHRGVWRDSYATILAQTADCYKTPLEAKRAAIRLLAQALEDEIEAPEIEAPEIEPPEIERFKEVAPLILAALDSGETIDFVALGAVDSVTAFILDFVLFVLRHEEYGMPRNVWRARNRRSQTALASLLNRDYQRALATVLGK
jgi:hypothetical protein